MKTRTYGVPIVRSERLTLPVHPGHCAPEEFGNWLQRRNGDRLAVDLFCGAGGLSLGLQLAGWTVAAGVDFDERALETHAHNFGGMSLRMDLGDPLARDHLVETLSMAKIDLIAGGPPCQPFSRAGKNKIRDLVENHGRNPSDLRKGLWQAYLDVVTRVGPRAIIMENVPDMGLSDDFAVLRVIEERLEGLGYATEVRIADAWQYGVPQHRKRLILLARNDIDRFDWPEPSRRNSLGEAISDLPSLSVIPRAAVGERVMRYEQCPELSKTEFLKQMRKGAEPDVIHDHWTRRVRHDDYEIFSLMDSSTLYSEVPPHLRRYRADNFTDKYKRLDADDLSRTITAHIAKDGYWYIHPTEHRTLTVREAARVQTFPDRFRFAGSRSDAFKQIGNAVPPWLGLAAASAVASTDDLDSCVGDLKPRWLAVRRALNLWAESDINSGAWYCYPGVEVGPVQAAVMALVSRSRLACTELSTLMNITRGWKRLNSRRADLLLSHAPTVAVENKLMRLYGAMGEPGIWDSRSPDLPYYLNLSPAEELLFLLLSDEQDLLLRTQTSFRVGARVNGSDSDQRNKHTEGRVDLARLVGAGDEASTRMAAIERIGSTLCRPRDPLCGSCPLVSACAEANPVSQSAPDLLVIAS